MSPFRLAVCAAVLSATAASAEITISDAYARSASPMAPTGAAFMVLTNSGAAGDRLIGVRSDAAKRVELHTHIDAGGGVLQMRHAEAGFEIPAQGSHSLTRGSDHVMLMGLTKPLIQGEMVTVILVFETAGEIEVEIPVDLTRAPDGH